MHELHTVHDKTAQRRRVEHAKRAIKGNTGNAQEDPGTDPKTSRLRSEVSIKYRYRCIDHIR